MGARKKHAPKRGSLAFSPRKRAKSIVPTIRSWPKLDVDKPAVLGFGGYKAGMIGVMYIENDPHSMDYGKEVYSAATIVETPPLLVGGIVAYGVNEKRNSLKTLGTAFAEKIPDLVKRRIVTLSTKNSRKNLEKIENLLDDVVKLRFLAVTQPHLAGIHKKTPEIFEVEVGGRASVDEKFKYIRGVLGRTIDVKEVFKPSDLIDVTAVTKGKGFQGPVKRWGIKVLPRKSRKTKRKAGALGPWKPTAVMYTVPMAGQMGFHRRTVYRIRVLDVKATEDKEGILGTPFPRYGVLKSSYMVLKGSVPGSVKRMVLMRHTIRPLKRNLSPPEIVYMHGVA